MSKEMTDFDWKTTPWRSTWKRTAVNPPVYVCTRVDVVLARIFRGLSAGNRGLFLWRTEKHGITGRSRTLKGAKEEVVLALRRG